MLCMDGRDGLDRSAMPLLALKVSMVPGLIDKSDPWIFADKRHHKCCC
jgi:hypothetical protein